MDRCGVNGQLVTDQQRSTWRHQDQVAAAITKRCHRTIGCGHVLGNVSSIEPNRDFA
jgi:hypothetical protein